MPARSPSAHRVEAEEDAHQLCAAVDHRRVDHLSEPRGGAFHERGEDSLHHERTTAAEIGEEVDGRDRRAAFGSDVPQHAHDREIVHVVADIAGEGTGLAPTGHARVDEARVAREARVGTDAEPFGDSGPEAFEQHVGVLAHTQHHLRPLRVLEVDADAAPAAVDNGVGRHEARNARSPVTGPSCDVGRPVEPHDLGAHVGQQHPRELHGADVRQLDDADPRERACLLPRIHGSLKTRFAFSRRNLGQT